MDSYVQRGEAAMSTWPDKEDAFTLYLDLLVLQERYTGFEKQLRTGSASSDDEQFVEPCMIGHFNGEIVGRGYEFLKHLDILSHYWYGVPAVSRRWDGFDDPKYQELYGHGPSNVKTKEPEQIFQELAILPDADFPPPRKYWTLSNRNISLVPRSTACAASSSRPAATGAVCGSTLTSTRVLTFLLARASDQAAGWASWASATTTEAGPPFADVRQVQSVHKVGTGKRAVLHVSDLGVCCHMHDGSFWRAMVLASLYFDVDPDRSFNSRTRTTIG